MENATSSIITITKPGTKKNPKSPIIQLTPGGKSRKWLKETKKEVTAEMKNSSFLCTAPETPRRAYWTSLKAILTALETGKPVEIWEIHRELGRKNPHFHDPSFGSACGAILPI